MMSELHAAHLLDLAEKVLAGTLVTRRTRATRAAAILARSALEDLVIDACAREGIDVTRTSIRVRLACLRALVPSIAGDAAVAWSGLSRACHQHAWVRWDGEVQAGVTELVGRRGRRPRAPRRQWGSHTTGSSAGPSNSSSKTRPSPSGRSDMGSSSRPENRRRHCPSQRVRQPTILCPSPRMNSAMASSAVGTFPKTSRWRAGSAT
jgi:hypothetical protein